MKTLVRNHGGPVNKKQSYDFYFNILFLKIYFLFNVLFFLFNFVEIFIHSINVFISFLSAIGVFLTHMTYGIGFIKGLLTKNFKSELR